MTPASSRVRYGPPPAAAQWATLVFAYMALLAIAAFPVFNVHNPPLQDYPNHLARMHILANPEAPFLRDYWGIHWSALPNLAMDLVVPWLAAWMPIEAAGKLFVVAIFVLLLSGTGAIHFALYRRLSPIPLLAVLFLPNLALQKGFLNYLFSVGLALWAYAGWIMVARRSAPVRIAYNLGLSPILYFSHLHGLAVYALMVIVSEIPGWQTERAWNWRGAGVRVLVALAGFVPILLFHALQSGISESSSSWVYPHWQDKLLLGRYLIPLFDDRLDAVMTLALAGVFLSGILARRLSYTKPVAGVLLALGTIYLVLPASAFTGANVDWRTLVPMAFIALGGARISGEPAVGRVWGLFLLAMLALVATLRFAYLNALWVAADEHYREARGLLRQLPEGARLFSAVGGMSYTEASQQRALLHIPAYAVIQRSAFVPSLFASPVQQPIRVQPAMAHHVTRHTRGTYLHADQPMPCAEANAGFDYALLITGTEPPALAPCGWEAVARTRSMHLFRIIRTS